MCAGREKECVYIAEFWMNIFEVHVRIQPFVDGKVIKQVLGGHNGGEQSKQVAIFNAGEGND